MLLRVLIKTMEIHYQIRNRQINLYKNTFLYKLRITVTYESLLIIWILLSGNDIEIHNQLHGKHVIRCNMASLYFEYWRKCAVNYYNMHPNYTSEYLLHIKLHIKVRLPVLLCAVKTVEGDFRFCWTTTPNVGQTHKENPNLVRILYKVCILNDIYKQYNKLHEHWYTKISSLRCVADRNPPQNASDLYTKYWSYAEHCRPCTRLSGVNWWKQKQITLIVPIGYSLFADHRSVPSSGPGFVCLTIFCLSRVCVH